MKKDMIMKVLCTILSKRNIKKVVLLSTYTDSSIPVTDYGIYTLCHFKKLKPVFTNPANGLTQCTAYGYSSMILLYHKK
jgi:hypothetical protein